jgi:hypothetical protein
VEAQQASNLFSTKQVEVEITKNGHSTNVAISWTDELSARRYQEWDGEFAEDDFLNEFGFKLKRN